MDRRTLLKSGSAALLGLGFGGCATSRVARKTLTFPADARSSLKLPLVEASWERVIRTTVGLRPHRDAGFLLRAEKLDEKLLVHNYGHGGSGMSLSWGTGYMAAEAATEHDQRRAAVIGCGVVGLTSARQLQRRRRCAPNSGRFAPESLDDFDPSHWPTSPEYALTLVREAEKYYIASHGVPRGRKCSSCGKGKD